MNEAETGTELIDFALTANGWGNGQGIKVFREFYITYRKIQTSGKRSRLLWRNGFFDSITEKIIGNAFAVSNSIGSGFLEKVYENTMMIELKKSGITVENKKTLMVYNDSKIVGKRMLNGY